MRLFRSWFCWVLIVLGWAVFFLPKMPFYENWMPYGYDLGGVALVVLYLSCGLGSLGFYGLMTGVLSFRSNSLKSKQALKVGSVALCLAIGLVWGYGKLMQLTLRL